MNPLVIAAIATMSLGAISWSTPWGGAATRAISVLHLDAATYFVPLIPTLLLTSALIIVIAYFLGRGQRKRIDENVLAGVAAELAGQERDRSALRNWRLWFNAGLTMLLLVLLVAGVAPLVTLFMAGFVIALLVNHPGSLSRAMWASGTPPPPCRWSCSCWAPGSSPASCPRPAWSTPWPRRCSPASRTASAT